MDNVQVSASALAAAVCRAVMLSEQIDAEIRDAAAATALFLEHASYSDRALLELQALERVMKEARHD